MNHVTGNFRIVNVPHGAFCPDFSTGNSITLEEYAQKGLEKELQFQQSIAQEKLIKDAPEPDPLELWFRQAKQRISFLKTINPALDYIIVENALNALGSLRLNRILPTLINRTGDESLLFEFFLGEDYFSIDFYDSGEIVYLRKTEDLPAHVIELDIEDIPEVATEIAHAQAGRSL